jgi:hypothetical protein
VLARVTKPGNCDRTGIAARHLNTAMRRDRVNPVPKQKEGIRDRVTPETDHRMSEADAVAAGYRIVPLASRWLFVRTRTDRLALRRFDGNCLAAMRRAEGEPPAGASIPVGDQPPPVSLEARYARSRGRYGRRRGEDDHSASNAKRPGWNRGVAYWGRSATRPPELDIRFIADRSPHNQALALRAAFWSSRDRARPSHRQRERAA